FNYESLADLPVIEEFEADDNPVNLFDQDEQNSKEINFDEGE
ncbi:SMC-Scp complex subunit ScpB, partial [Lactobacillus gasseri]